MGAFALLHRATALFEKIQVDLQGQYSVERLRHLDAYCAKTSNLWVFWVLASMPLPCLALITLIELIPMQDPAKGLSHSALFFVRSAIVGFVIALALLDEHRRFVPSLALSFQTTLVMAVLVTCITAGYEVSFAHLIGYPLPFSIILSSPVRFAAIGIVFALWYGKLIWTDPDVRQELFACQRRLAPQTLFVVFYPLYNFAFQNLASSAQTGFTLLLPLIKVVTKNLIARALVDMEDAKPEMVISNCEVFHALYVSVCLQSSRSAYTTTLFMGMDFVQFLASMSDVLRMLRAITALQRHLLGSELPVQVAAPTGGRLVTESALYILDNDAQIERHPSVIGVARKINVTVKRSGTVQLSIRERSKLLLRLLSNNRVFPATNALSRSPPAGLSSIRDAEETTRGPPINAIPQVSPSGGGIRATDEAAPIQAMVAKVKYVQQILQLLHLVEFVLLVELMEVVVPVIYCGYLVVASSLSNRDFYSLFKGIDEVEISSKLGNVLLYALLEFASFLLLAMTLQYKTRMPSFHQVAFAIESQWGHVQAKVLVWVLFTIQFPLEHFGISTAASSNLYYRESFDGISWLTGFPSVWLVPAVGADPTFKFAWLRS